MTPSGGLRGGGRGFGAVQWPPRWDKPPGTHAGNPPDLPPLIPGEPEPRLNGAPRRNGTLPETRPNCSSLGGSWVSLRRGDEGQGVNGTMISLASEVLIEALIMT
ncbi:hypothetical protein AAFF_G00042330 [Aldrovandia affinis]|uniref:Uncharacterized protein n=1 Tax=Aldrovandia affinis TaxID=143900 RepID=A0AAD7S2W8_9TELE|nr:hypothetical protein AAFF_G00042330 [Aldrovandia affinis]